MELGFELGAKNIQFLQLYGLIFCSQLISVRRTVLRIFALVKLKTNVDTVVKGLVWRRKHNIFWVEVKLQES